MRCVFVALSILCGFIGNSAAESVCQRRHVESTPTPMIRRAVFDALLPRHSKGVLVLVPGANGDARGFLNETNWTVFAEKKGWAVVAATFLSPENALKKNSGYYNVTGGSGAMLISALKDMGLDSSPIYIYGFSGGARFAAGFAMSYPSIVAGWAALAPSDAVAIHGDNVVPGIVACGIDDSRLGACLSWFKGLRAEGRRVSWVEVPKVAHSRSVAFECFVRNWFSEEETRRRGRSLGVWVDLGDGSLINSASPCSASNRSWFPSQDAYRHWLDLVTDGSRQIISQRMFTHANECPYLTMYLSRPLGVVSNVLCLSLLANRPSDVEWRLRVRDRRGTVGKFLDFADSNCLAVVAWGAPRSLWKPRYNWDSIDREERRHLSLAFAHVAKGWEKAIDGYVRKYDIPASGYLMAGFSGSAQFAQRLALHSPGRFRAVAIHIASSYDYPLPAARRILWCVTTGENESGYDRSLKFFNAAKDSGYAMIYKAYPGLGHRDSIQASVLACECFRFALGTAETIRMDYGRWPSVVDVVNQTVKKRDEESGIPAPFRCYLPNEKIVSAWTKY